MEKTYQLFILFLKSFASLIKLTIRSSFNLKKHKTENKSIYILGNGPSLNNSLSNHRNELISKDLMCVNGFPITDEFVKLKPKYFIVCSPGFYNYTATDYNVTVRKDIINALVKKTNWPLIFFLPRDAQSNHKFLQIIQENKNITIYYFNKTSIEGFQNLKIILYDKGIASPRPHNVMISAILQSLTSGYRHIYILGADHSWLPQISVNHFNEVLINQKHFYDEHKSIPKQMHKNEGKNNRKLHEVLDKFLISFRSYHELDYLSKYRNSEIINLTENSFIDAFKKIKSEDHFG